MPNWCTTSYALTGGRREVLRLYKMMKRLQERKCPLVPNAFGPSWLGCLVKALGRDPGSVYCRGEWSNLSLSEDGVLRFDTVHAWSRPEDVEDLIVEKCPSVSVYFLEEELGMDIFQTNDESGEFFKEQIIVDSEEHGMEYYDVDGALDRLSELLGTPVASWDEAETAVRRHNDGQDESGGDRHVWLHRADLV